VKSALEHNVITYSMKTGLLSCLALSLYAGTLAALAAADEKGATRLMGGGTAPADKGAATYSSFDRPGGRGDAEMFPQGGLKFEEADLAAVLKIYQELSGRTVIRAGSVPSVKITLETQTPLTRREALQTLDTALAGHQITMVLSGTKYVKVVPAPQAHSEAGPVIELPPDQLPESGSYLTYIVKVRDRNPTELLAVLQPFAKLPNSIVAIKEPGLLILRDYSANVRRMLMLLERIEKESK
jgi:type II secretory pathway component GspD/PulD (secretin)